MTHPRRAARFSLAGAGLALALAGCGADAVPAAGPTNIDIIAVNVAFDPTILMLPAQTPIHVTFENRDVGVPHGIAIALRTSGVKSPELGRSEIIVGEARAGFDIMPLAPGPYLFSCPVHPGMQIEVEVG